MAPRQSPRAVPSKVQSNILRSIVTKSKTTPVSGVKQSSKTPMTEKKPIKLNNSSMVTRQRTCTVPKIESPKSKENKSIPVPGSVTKSAKKAWKRHPKPAHSGVPVPEKMRRLAEKQLQDADCSL